MSSASASSSFHLVSWNVAGWATTHQEITRSYPSSVASSRAASGGG